MNLQYRDAVPDDLGEIVRIYNTTIASRMVTADLEPVTVADKLRWFHDHHATRPLWMVYDEAGELLGWVSYQSFYGRPAYNATAELSIYLDEPARGRGVGKAALEYAINYCPVIGLKTLLGFIFAHNEPSLQLFRNAGFESWAHFPDIALMDGIERSLIIMGRKV